MENLFLSISAIIVCSSFLAWLASQGRQPVILAYFVCGLIIGPFGFKLVPEVDLLEDMSRIGVTLLLFLAGLVLHPDRLFKFFRTAIVLVVAGCGFIWILVFLFSIAWGWNMRESAIIACALMFSSTILVIKLLPTTTLHQRRMGSICIAVLIAEDLLAVLALIFVGSAGAMYSWLFFARFLAAIVVLTALAIIVEQYVIRRMMRMADRYNEVLVMLCLGWCVGVASIAELIGVPYEVGAFVAGVAMARGKIALVLSEELKPLRDFFLMFFFFVLGATFDFSHASVIWLPAFLLAFLILVMRPLWFQWLFLRLKEEKPFAKETALRLGPGSEFALIIAASAMHGGNLGSEAVQLIQLTTIVTMVISSYIVVFRYPTPIGFRPGLQKD